MFCVSAGATDTSLLFVPNAASYAAPAVQSVRVKINGITPSFA